MYRSGWIMAAALLLAGAPAWALDSDGAGAVKEDDGKAIVAKDDGKAIVGQWETEGGRSHVAIAEKDDAFHGAIVWLKEPAYPEGDPEAGEAKRDRNNPDTEAQHQPLIGLRLIEGFTHDGGNTWSGGTIYDPESGNTYKCKITLDGDKLYVRGYIGISMFGRTTIWTRHEPPEGEEEASMAEAGEAAE